MARHAGETDTTDETSAELEHGIGSFFDEKVGGSGGAGSNERDADADESDNEDEEEGEEEEDEDSEDDDEQSDDDDDESDEDEGEDDSEDDDEESDEEDEDEDEDEDDDLDPEVQAAADRHQLPTRFEDIIRKLPKGARADARQAFHARLKEVESGLGRAFQEARVERRELAKLKAERKHEDEHRIDHIADLLDTDPKLLEQLNEELEKRETAAYRDAKKMTRDRAKQDVEAAAEQDVQKAEQRRQRGQQVSALAERLARQEGVPFKVVDKALYIAVMNSADKDVPDEVIRQIVKREARDWRKLTGERKREHKQEYIKGKSKQIRDAKRRVTPRDRGHAPAPGRRREPKSLEEALTLRAKAILPDAPA